MCSKDQEFTINAASVLFAVVLSVGLTAMTVMNAQGHGEPLRYGIFMLPVAVLFFWSFRKARAKRRHPVLLFVLVIAAVFSFGAAINWLLWNAIAELTPI
ncbi:hypothetical protein [Pseudomonas sp. 460]|uniref:hypothetical protein n=1 Tax=Pseudomonas sp. 460 TaxID=2485142 RepID=UPI00104AEAC9|nr:hypothetical protein [Pseudomonas sp. 460]TCV51399.1 hypothetical protein EDB99_10765 [Pseudomonas sp. 460]